MLRIRNIVITSHCQSEVLMPIGHDALFLFFTLKHLHFLFAVGAVCNSIRLISMICRSNETTNNLMDRIRYMGRAGKTNSICKRCKEIGVGGGGCWLANGDRIKVKQTNPNKKKKIVCNLYIIILSLTNICVIIIFVCFFYV